MMIKEMRSEDKPRERFAKAPDTASMVDLVAILLRTGRTGVLLWIWRRKW